MVDFTKPVQTRDGKPVRVLCTDKVGHIFPVVALVMDGKHEIVKTYTCEGREFAHKDTGSDLVNVPRTRTVWLNLYEDILPSVYTTKYGADLAAADNRIRCVEYTFDL